MIVSMHQPAYLPWLGYLERIARSDVFVFLDTVQFEKNSFTNRNRLRSDQGPFWMSIPVLHKGHTNSTLAETRIDPSANWKRKHLASIQQSYGKAPCFEARFPGLLELYAPEFDLLSELCWHQLQFWIEALRLDTRVVRASDLDVHSSKSQLVLDLCNRLGADHYLSGPLGRDYLDVEIFRDSGIHVEFHDYVHPVYPQVHDGFQSHLGIVDAWLNCQDCSKFLQISS